MVVLVHLTAHQVVVAARAHRHLAAAALLVTTQHRKHLPIAKHPKHQPIVKVVENDLVVTMKDGVHYQVVYDHDRYHPL